MTANSCVSGLTYKVILPSNYSSMVNTLVIMLDNETEVSDGNFPSICEPHELPTSAWPLEITNTYVLPRLTDAIRRFSCVLLQAE